MSCHLDAEARFAAISHVRNDVIRAISTTYLGRDGQGPVALVGHTFQSFGGSQMDVEYCLLWIDWWATCLTKGEWSSWVQALGSLLALAIAIAIPVGMHVRERAPAPNGGGSNGFDRGRGGARCHGPIGWGGSLGARRYAQVRARQ